MEPLNLTMSGSEHWLTVMACTVCRLTPDESPLYACHLGHYVCYTCFKRLAMYGMPKCPECKSDNFHVIQVAQDFLRKLKIKPGIGRPCRYKHQKRDKTALGDLDQTNVMKDHTITVEKLFSLDRDQLKVLFSKPKIEGCSKDQLGNWKFKPLERKNKGHCRVKQQINLTSSGKYILKEKPDPLFQSKKPLICPHDPCHKIISISSCQTHFRHDHSDLPKYCIEREQVLHLRLNPKLIEIDTTLCMGLISVYDINRLAISNKASPGVSRVVRRLNQKNPIDTFWIMVSGSSGDCPENAYVIFWMFTDKANSSDFYSCTVDVSSENDRVSYSTYCDVNDLYDSQNMLKICQDLNCLYLSYGCLENLLKEGPKLNLRLIIH